MLVPLGTSIEKKTGELGLLKLYQRSSSTNTFCRKLMALPFLPSEHIPGAFYELKRLCANHTGLTQFCGYIERQWIVNDFYRPDRWSVFMKDVRTNNDLEGWHRRLNNHARRGQIQFYLLVELLHKEANFVSIQTKLVSDGKLKCHQRKRHRALQKDLKKIWKKYNEEHITVSQLLSGCIQVTHKL